MTEAERIYQEGRHKVEEVVETISSKPEASVEEVPEEE